MSFKEEFGSQVTGFVCSAGAAWTLIEDDVVNVSLKGLIILISGIIGGASSMLGRYWMKKYLNKGTKNKKDSDGEG